MKRLYFIISNIMDLYNHNKTLFIFMVIGILLSNFMLVYGFGNISSYNKSALDGANKKEYCIEYLYSSDDVKGETQYENIEKINITGLGIEAYCVSRTHANTQDDQRVAIPIKNHYAMTPLSTREFIDVCAYYNDKINKDIECYAGKFDFVGVGDKNVAIVPCNEKTKELVYDEKTESYGSLFIGENEFIIIGISTAVDRVIVPWTQFFEVTYTQEIKYYTSVELPRYDSKVLYERLCEIHNVQSANGSSTYAYRSYENSVKSYKQSVTLIFCEYIVSLLSFVFYTNYFTKRGERKRAICMICGSTKIRLMTNLFLSNLLLTISCFAFMLFINVIFGDKINIFASVRYGLRDIIYMTLIVVTATVITTLPAAVTVSNSTSSELCRSAV